MILSDTHCHLDLDRFDPDRGLVIERAMRAGLSRILIPSLDLDSARRVVGLAAEHPMLYAAVGIHPTAVHSIGSSMLTELKSLASARSVVAIGEVGLDYYWVTDKGRRQDQQAALRAQLELAQSCALPVVLHVREQGDAEHGACIEDTLRILEEWMADLHKRGSPLGDHPGVLHSFSGNLDTAVKAVALGFCLGVTGPITYPAAENRRALVRHLPLESLLIETDAPFLAPQQQRGHRNEPAFVVHIADRIAQVQSRPLDEVARVTSQNAARLFAWGEPE